MKIPGTPVDSVHSVAVPTPYENTDARGIGGGAYVGALDKVGNAAENIDVAMKRADAEAERQAKEAKAKADAISAANADAAYQRAETSSLVGRSNRSSLVDQAFNGPDGAPDPTAADVQNEPGFLSTRGKDAFDKSGAVIEDLEKQRQQIAKDHFGDPEARERWLAHSNELMAGTERRVEQHAAQQFQVAQKDALEGVRASALEVVATAKDSETIANIAASTEARIRQLQDSKEGGDADVAKFRRDVLVTRITSLLVDGDLEHAEGQYEVGKAALGTAGPQVKHAIDTAKKASDVRSNDVAAQKQVDALIDAGTGPEGKPDLEVIDAQASRIPPGKLRDEIDQRLGPAKEKALRRWKQRVDRFADEAGATFEKTLSLGAIDPKVKSWLIENAPDEWKKLRHDAEARATHLRGVRTGDAAARREQAEIDKLALLEWHELSTEERASNDPAAFLRGRGVSPVGSAAVRVDQTKAKEILAKGDAVGEAEFVAKVKASTQGLVGSDKEKAKDINSQAVQAYGNLRAQSKGKPSNEEVQAEIDRLTKVEATKPRNALIRWIPGVNPAPETVIERQAREQKAKKGVVTPPPAGKRQRVKDAKGRLGWWDGVSPLPPGYEVTGG